MASIKSFHPIKKFSIAEHTVHIKGIELSHSTDVFIGTVEVNYQVINCAWSKSGKVTSVSKEVLEIVELDKLNLKSGDFADLLESAVRLNALGTK